MERFVLWRAFHRPGGSSSTLASALLAVGVLLLQIPPARAASNPQVWVQQVDLPSGFVPRSDSAAAAFPPLGQIVLFGGAPTQLGESWHNDTWVYSTATDSWAQGPAAPAGLTPRGGMAMAFDTAIGKIVLFGGAGEDEWAPRNDTWLFDGSTWTQGPAAPSGLGPRVFFGMTYDPGLGKVVLAGGDGAFDVWYFDGAAWTPGPALTTDIGPRERLGLAYHPLLEGDVLFGGLGPGAGNTMTYLLKDGVWSVVTLQPTPRPAARVDPNMVWDPVNSEFLVFGGAEDGNYGKDGLSDTWKLVAPPMAVVPTSGVSGTVVTIDSGPGWPVGQSVDVVIDKTVVDTVTPDAEGMVHTTATVTGRPCPKTKVVKLKYLTWSLVLKQDFSIVCLIDEPGVGAGTATPAVAGHPRTPAWPGRHRRASTPHAATGTISAHDGQFWVGSNPVLLHGIDGAPFSSSGPLVDSDYATIASWNMNLVRLWVHWGDFELDPPVKTPKGAWTHTFNTDKMDDLKTQIGYASAHGEYVLIENYCGPPCFHNGWPDWLYTAPYNSHQKDYTDAVTANTDYWTDDLQRQFTGDWLSWLAGQLKDTPGVAGYEVLNEPAPGTYADNHDTTQMMLDAELPLAQTIRDADPSRTIFFTTRDSSGEGLPNADLSGWTALGNVAFDVHDYFGGRWGGGLNLDPSDPVFGEALGPLYNFTITDGMPPYLGTTYGQMRWVQTYQASLGGIPLFVGEFGGNGEAEPNVMTLFGTMTQAFNLEGVAWTAMSYTGQNDVWKANGDPEPWVDILSSAAAFGTADYEATVLRDHPVLYWRLGETSGSTAGDSTGNGYTGIIGSAVSLGQPSLLSTDPDPSMSFPISPPTIPGIVYTLNGPVLSPPYTVEFWVKLPVGPLPAGGRYDVSLSKNLYFPFFAASHSNTGKPVLYLGASSYLYGSTDLADGKVHHLVFVVTATGAGEVPGQIYVDGVQEVASTTVSSGAPVASDGGVYAGYDGAAGDAPRWVDEVAVYPSALSPAQILAHYQAGLAG